MANGQPINGSAPTVSLQGQQVVVITQLDLAAHMLDGIANQLEHVFREPGPASIIRKAMESVLTYRGNYFKACQQRVVLATPADLPK